MTSLLLYALLAQSPAPPRVSFSGYVQPQYEVRTADGDTSDRTLFRRMFFTLDARPFEHWQGQFQVDTGRLVSFGDVPVVKNAYIQYTGWQDAGLTLTIGNQKPPFSRSLIASSSRRALIERPFTGDRAYGNPGRAAMVKLEGSHSDRHIYWSVAGGTSRQDPDPDEVRIDGPAEAGIDGTNEGPLAAARVDVHPFGEASRDHTDFRRTPSRMTLGAAVYGWWNDDDAGRHGDDAIDLSRVQGYEVSAALRGHGAWADVAYNYVDARAIDARASSTLYRSGHARLRQASVEGGYLLWRERLEAVAMFDTMQADAFEETWHRVTAEMNVYMHRHDLKMSAMHRASFDEKGVRGARSHTTYLQMQFVF